MLQTTSAPLQAMKEKATKTKIKTKHKPKSKMHKRLAKDVESDSRRKGLPISASALTADSVNGGDRYRPSPILDDFSQHSEGRPPKLDRKLYERELASLQVELVKMQYWVKHVGYRLILLFEGRDAAGKGGTIRVKLWAEAEGGKRTAIFESGPIHGGEMPVAIAADAPGMKYFEIELEAEGDDWKLGRVVWLDPVVIAK